MHEASIAQALLDALFEQAEPLGAKRIVAVRLQIGEAAGVVVEALELAIDALSRDTIAEGLAVHVERVPLAVRCRDCDSRAVAETWLMVCAACGSRAVDVISGRELRVLEMDIEE